jgi:predicted ATPase
MRQRTKPKPIQISIKFDDSLELTVSNKSKEEQIRVSEFAYNLSLDLRTNENIPIIRSEKIQASVRKGERPPETFTLTRSEREVEIEDPSAGDDTEGSRRRTIPVPEQEKSRPALVVGFFSLPCVILRGMIASWSFFNISPSVARQPAKETPDADLGLHGENLALILHKLDQGTKISQENLDSVMSGLKSIIPSFKGIKPVALPFENKKFFQILEERIKGGLNPDSISDGTIRLIALVVIATWSVKESGLIAIEEPETGLHPHLAEYIVETLRAASEKCQIIVTTHSPYFLDHLKPEEVILCEKVDGFTQFHQASDVEDIEVFRKNFRLGDLWMQGALGGIP